MTDMKNDTNTDPNRLDIECGCGCGQLAVDDSMVVSDEHGFARETRDGSTWLAACYFEASMP